MKNIITIIFAVIIFCVNRISATLTCVVGTIQNVITLMLVALITVSVNIIATVSTVIQWKGFMGLSPLETAKMHMTQVGSSCRFLICLFGEYQKHVHVSWMKRPEAVIKSLLKDNKLENFVSSAM